MMITTMVVAGGAVATGIKVYRDKKRENEYPWRVAAERMAKKDGVLARSQSGFLVIGQRISNLLYPQKLIEGIKEPAEDEISEISKIEREIDRELAVAVATLGLRVAPHGAP